MLKTATLLTLITVGFFPWISISYFFFGDELRVFALLSFFGALLFGLIWGGRVLLGSLRAKRVRAVYSPNLREMTSLFKFYDKSRPELYVFNSDEINGFYMKSLFGQNFLCITDSALEKLNTSELNCLISWLILRSDSDRLRLFNPFLSYILILIYQLTYISFGLISLPLIVFGVDIKQTLRRVCAFYLFPFFLLAQKIFEDEKLDRKVDGKIKIQMGDTFVALIHKLYGATGSLESFDYSSHMKIAKVDSDLASFILTSGGAKRYRLMRATNE